MEVLAKDWEIVLRQYYCVCQNKAHGLLGLIHSIKLSLW